jgi:uncharacterized protein involved in exopolysaccharide biosynthesis
MENENIKRTASDEIDLIELIRHLWNGRKLILKITGAFILLGLIIAITTPEQFNAEARLLPEVKSSGAAGGAAALLKQFGGLGGFSMPTDGADAIGPMLYPDVLKSTPFFMELLSSKINYESKEGSIEITVYEYLNEHTKSSFLGVLKKYTIGLPWTVIGWFKSDDKVVLDANSTFEKTYLPRMTREQFETIKELRGKISSSIDQKSGIIRISAELPDPYVAAQVVNFTVDYISTYITQYRTEKTLADLVFIEERYTEKEKEYISAQRELARYRDANLNVQSAAVRSEEERLNNKYTLAFNVYNGLAQQLEQAKIKVQEETPVITVLEPVQVPVERSKPKRSLILVVFAFLGGFLGVGFIFGKLIWENISQQLKTESN